MKGTVYVNNGRWYYAVRFPGEKARTACPLRAPGAMHAMTADRPRELAIQAAWRIWEERTKPVPTTAVRHETVDAIAARYIEHSLVYYRHADGTPTSEAGLARLATRQLRELYGTYAPAELTHADMIRVRDLIMATGVARVTVNKYMDRVRRMWAWALDEGLVSAAVKAELTQVRHLKPYRSSAPETEPVRPVPDVLIEAVLPFLSRNMADMVRLHRVTGMRPGELCGLTWADIDTTCTPWIYQPRDHKMAYRGKVRAVLIGPKGRGILERHRGDLRPFSPRISIAEHIAALREAHGTVKTEDMVDCPQRIGDAWCTLAYARTISRACERAKCDHWHPNQIRHTFATQARRAEGIMVAGALLGHSAGLRVTDGYSRDAAVDEIVRIAGSAIERIG